MPKLTIEDLSKIREKAKGGILCKDGPFRVKVTVHMGTCGIAAGARDIMNTLMSEIETNKAADVYLTTSGCAGLCSHEPMATVEISGKIPVKYIDLTPGKAKEIFERHIMGREAVMEYALAVGSERSI